MKKFFALILICTLCLALCACGQQAQAPETDGGVKIVATVFPAYDFARQIAGDDGNDEGRQVDARGGDRRRG